MSYYNSRKQKTNTTKKERVIMMNYFNEMYREAENKESLMDRLVKYFKENAEFIIYSLTALNGQFSYTDRISFAA